MSIVILALLLTKILMGSVSLGRPQQLIKILEKADIDSTLFINGQMSPRLVSGNFLTTEGPAVSRDGNIYFTDKPADRIYRYDLEGKLSIFKERAGRPSGMYIDASDNLITCSGKEHEIWSTDLQGKSSVLLSSQDFEHLNGPNDLWINKNGDIYFTDSYYPAKENPSEKIKSDTTRQRVLLSPAQDRKNVKVVDQDLKKPNGIVGSADGKTMYVADIAANKTYRYSVGADGSLLDKTVFIEIGADGIILDERGNLYLTGNEITIGNASGKIIGHITTPSKKITNLCFGGKERNLLFITAFKEIYVLAMNVRGIE
ncbi:SMP-30/gluconolactonase/LRE family protein [Dyadobacter sp. CY345]|uniref:SMP-30/gluconolactonase/LRE family protein n=1 Tax=Dyadobacter sp. CY345 TaxID=2909335 RepID=UPI001F3240CA|nr:SMP-30/gluconolactonase/LRE family protein [Dyadobacter sp. CY345]MCF2443270.1 SMP-30/gluconolactonase/LRE family protein [Dyadobacter sp. CY345]